MLEVWFFFSMTEQRVSPSIIVYFMSIGQFYTQVQKFVPPMDFKCGGQKENVALIDDDDVLCNFFFALITDPIFKSIFTDVRIITEMTGRK